MNKDQTEFMDELRKWAEAEQTTMKQELETALDSAKKEIESLLADSGSSAPPELTDAVAEWQLINTPIEINATDEELRALEAQP